MKDEGNDMKTWVRNNFSLAEWLVGGIVTTLAVLAWVFGTGSSGTLSLLKIFPVFGLVAFGLMWSHYTVGTLRRWSGYERRGKDIYWAVSAGLVLALIILHPVLLNISLVEAGLGLPTSSYFAAYGNVDGWFVVLGTIALLVFLLFELHRWFKHKKWWKWIEYAQIVAMTAIFVHGTWLGNETTNSWYTVVWWGLALTLLFTWVYNWRYDKAHLPRR